MDVKYLQLLAVIEGMSVFGTAAWVASRDLQLPFVVGFNTLLPVTGIIAAHGEGTTWRKLLLLGFVTVYLGRMNWVLFRWFRSTAGAKLRNEVTDAHLLAIPFVLCNVFGWLYCMPFLWAADRTTPFDAWDFAAIALYAVGTVFHFGADYQKHQFKQRPGSAGKLLNTGFWGLCRHPNYFGDFLIYTAFGITAASPWGLVAPAANLMQYATDAIPQSEMMARKRYGDQWVSYCKRVSCFVPYIL